MATITKSFILTQNPSVNLTSLALQINDDGVLLTPIVTTTTFPSNITTGLPAGVTSVMVGTNNNGVLSGVITFDDTIINGNLQINYTAIYNGITYTGSYPTKIIPC